MLQIRKVDCYGQAILASLMILSVPLLFIYGFLFGLLILGCWQLISAALNTVNFIREGYRSKILLYWKLCAADLLLLVLFWIATRLDIGNAQIIFWTTITGSVVIVIYYWRIYFILLEHLLLNNELHGLIKSKH